MRPIDKSSFTTNKLSYTPYGDAKDDLIEAIGSYCSYCERAGFSSAIHVEHIKDKETYPDKKNDWDNFLLACTNCNAIKGRKEVNDEVYMPHRNNTFITFNYLESGLIEVNKNITVTEQEKAKKLMLLVGLDRVLGHPNYSIKDKRYMERKKTDTIANKYLKKYQNQECDKETIIDLAIPYGFWSIWMNTFKDCPEVQNQLIQRFNGTNQQYIYSTQKEV